VESRWQEIYKKLKDGGIDVYAPSQKTGECLKPYVVVKDGGLTDIAGISSSQHVYDILCYVPKANYSTLEPYVERVEDILLGLYPTLRPLNSKTPSYYDDTVKAHMISVSYTNYRKNRR
jgi:hypothetical protein